MKYSVAGTLVLVSLSGCSSLTDTDFEKQMSKQGSWSCPVHSTVKPDAKETLAEANVPRIRCYQDLWQIKGEEAYFTRTFYSNSQCETILGRITYRSNKPDDSAQCKLVRANPSWVSEDKGTCLLNQLNLNSETSIDAIKKCPAYLPPFCLKSKDTLKLQPQQQTDKSLPPDLLKITDSKYYDSTCKRYLQ